MNILIINDYLKYGGAEIQSIREKKILENKGNKVYLLTLDEYNINNNYYKDENNYINIPIKYNFFRRNLHRLGLCKINHKLYKEINNQINNIKPDIIHINNINKEPFTIFKAIKNYNTVQTLRDYSAICPKGTCILENGEICDGFKFNSCNELCNNTIVKKFRFMLWKSINHYRKESIKKYIAPSKKLTDMCKNNGYDIVCINNSFDVEKYSNLKKEVDFDNKIYLYYGAINNKKGVIELINAFNKFKKEKNTQLFIAGQVFDDVREIFENKVNESAHIKYLGNLEYDIMLKTLSKIHTIVVPSIWMENYPNTVLEGLAMKTFVIGSNRGGIPEMLENGKGYVFDVTDQESIINALEKSYKLSKEKYIDIVKSNYEYTIENNSIDTYYKRIMKYFISCK